MDSSTTTTATPTKRPVSRRDLLRFLSAGLGAGVLTVAGAGRAVAAIAADTPTWGIVEGGPNPGQTPNAPRTPPAPPSPNFAEIIARVEQMPFDSDLTGRASRHGLDIINVTWEDTGRNLGSSVGPNISDLTLQVREPVTQGTRTHLLPVLRYPNFSDKTADVRLDKLWVRVGNQDRRTSRVTVPLSEVLGNMRAYLSDPYSLSGSGNFLRKRDTHALVSAQHVFMPLPAEGTAEFTPVLYNYQSSRGNPAVLTLMVTREGTSASVIQNWSGDQSYQSWGQQLYFNNKGQRTVFTAERKSAVKRRVESGRAKASDAGALDAGSDMVMIIQVPLIHRYNQPEPYQEGELSASDSAAAAAAPSTAAAAGSKSAAGGAVQPRSDVEAAVIGHGDDQGPFDGMLGMSLERDERFPIRVTVQFYRATSNGVVSDADLADVKRDIDRVYSSGDFVGSLVVPTDDRPRPTAWIKARTPGWPYRS